MPGRRVITDKAVSTDTSHHPLGHDSLPPSGPSFAFTHPGSFLSCTPLGVLDSPHFRCSRPGRDPQGFAAHGCGSEWADVWVQVMEMDLCPQDPRDQSFVGRVRVQLVGGTRSRSSHSISLEVFPLSPRSSDRALELCTELPQPQASPREGPSLNSSRALAVETLASWVAPVSMCRLLSG